MSNIGKKPIQVLTGLRRVGKSTIALQCIKTLIEKGGIDPKKILFFSIEEPLLHKAPIAQILDDFRAEHRLRSDTKIFVFIDEIQAREGWEQEIKSLYDTQKAKFILTGSSAMLLSEKVAWLTGRFLKIQVDPLDFREYLNFKKHLPSKLDEPLLIRDLENYLREGGLPEYILDKPDRYLETTVESILFKDLVSRYELRNPQLLLDLLYLLSDRVGFRSSSLRLSAILQINKDTVLSYLNNLNKIFITSELRNFSYSRNKQLYNPPKIYFEDTGILNTYASKSNMGALAENAIFSYLKNKFSQERRYRMGYWYENKKEVDFVLETTKGVIAIEAKWINSPDEVDTTQVEDLLKYTAPQKIIFATRSLKHTVKAGKKTVQFIPLYEILLNSEEYLF